MTHWILSIQEYVFDIKHCKGRNNIVGDIMNCNHEETDSAYIKNTSGELEMSNTTVQINQQSAGKI